MTQLILDYIIIPIVHCVITSLCPLSIVDDGLATHDTTDNRSFHCGDIKPTGLYISDTLHIMKMVNNSVKRLYNGLILCLVSRRLHMPL